MAANAQNAEKPVTKAMTGQKIAKNARAAGKQGRTRTTGTVASVPDVGLSETKAMSGRAVRV